jgi:hypothetical protein
MAVYRFTKNNLRSPRITNRTMGVYAIPDAPTMGTATKLGPTGLNSASISFTSATPTQQITSYTVKSWPNNDFTGTGTSSPIVVSGFNTGARDYVFTVTATNLYGTSNLSAPSNILSLDSSL